MKLKFVIDKKYDIGDISDKEKLRWIEKQYKKTAKYLKITKELYQKSWNEINEDFSDYVEKITGHKWHYENYKCVLSVFRIGVSNWGTAPIVARWWKENPYAMRRITAHELIFSHYFEIYKRNYKNENLSDGQVWALAEIAAFALTSLTKEVDKFWSWDTEYYTNHNYKHIVELQLKLKGIFLQRKSFDEYMEKGFELIKEYPNMNPQGI